MKEQINEQMKEPIDVSMKELKEFISSFNEDKRENLQRNLLNSIRSLKDAINNSKIALEEYIRLSGVNIDFVKLVQLQEKVDSLSNKLKYLIAYKDIFGIR